VTMSVVIVLSHDPLAGIGNAHIATCLTRIGTPPRSATTMLPISSAERSSPMPRMRYCCLLVRGSFRRHWSCRAAAPKTMLQRHLVSRSFPQVGIDLVLLDEAAETDDVGTPG